jgi:hypothetical protein
MSNDISKRIAQLKQKQEQLARRLNALEQKEKSEARKLDTRRKIIVGGVVLSEMQKDQFLADLIQDLLARYVARPNDRAALADLLPLS